MMRKKVKIPAPVGASSLLVIFSVLCLTAFSMLTLSTVKADERLADESYAAVQAYYQADFEAEQLLGRLRNGETVEQAVKKGNCYYYSCPVGETQKLRVIVEINGSDYKIHQWKLEGINNWEPDQHMDLFEAGDMQEE